MFSTAVISNQNIIFDVLVTLSIVKMIMVPFKKCEREFESTERERENLLKEGRDKLSIAKQQVQQVKQNEDVGQEIAAGAGIV